MSDIVPPQEYEHELLCYGQRGNMTEPNQATLLSLESLREPFPPSAISKLPKGGVLLDFVGHATTTDRLLSADPFWTWEPFALDERDLPAVDCDANGKPVGLWIKLTVCGVTRPGYGSCEARKTEPMKELIGDALRNAAMRFGVALDLWAKSDLESQIHDTGQSTAQSNARSQEPARTQQNTPQRPQAANTQAPNTNRVSCPKCEGAMWDNRAKKASGEISANAPDFKCKDRENCDGVVWPPKDGQVQQARDNGAQNARQAETLSQYAANPDAELAETYN